MTKLVEGERKKEQASQSFVFPLQHAYIPFPEPVPLSLNSSKLSLRGSKMTEKRRSQGEIDLPRIVGPKQRVVRINNRLQVHPDSHKVPSFFRQSPLEQFVPNT